MLSNIYLDNACTEWRYIKEPVLIDLFKFKGNEAKDHIPEDIQEILNRLIIP